MLSLSITNPDSTNSPHSNFTDIMRSIRHLLMLLLLACCTASCSNHKQKEALDRAEYLMEAHPDSALIILNEIENRSLVQKKNRPDMRSSCLWPSIRTISTPRLLMYSSRP